MTHTFFEFDGPGIREWQADHDHSSSERVAEVDT
jgi:hypothetical protein